jgi:hypothetical protein
LTAGVAGSTAETTTTTTTTTETTTAGAEIATRRATDETGLGFTVL